MFGQSTFVTMAVHQTSNRLIGLALRCIGKNELTANLVASNLSTQIAAAAGGVLSVATVDPVGAAGSVSYLALVMGETNQRIKEHQARLRAASAR